MDTDNPLKTDATELGHFLVGMREAFASGGNAMEFARKHGFTQSNSAISALIAYDLQAGSYIDRARENPEDRKKWCGQLAGILNPYIDSDCSLLEVGCGEATTLAGVLLELENRPAQTFGFDISWSRCAHGRNWLAGKGVSADLFVADLFEIPLEDSSIDVVYTSHSIEPNGGREKEAIEELLRVARRAVVLIEPIYEIADVKAQARMNEHGYVRDLKQAAEDLGANVKDYRLLDYCGNPLNPSGLILLEKSISNKVENSSDVKWRCPLTNTPLVAHPAGYFSPQTGIVYPVLAEIPLLRASHAVVASEFASSIDETENS